MWTPENLTTYVHYAIRNVVLMKIFGRTHAKLTPRDAKAWEALRASIAGQDTWLVVGNGPSLKLDDIEAFEGVPTIASNKINILFSKTKWRPTLYTIADPLVLHKLPARHYDDFPLTLLPDTHVIMGRAKSKLTWHHLLDAEGEKKYVEQGEALSPVSGLFVGGTITVPNLLLAMWAGAKTIYVIGVDHFYSGEDAKTGSRKVKHQGPSNHFDPNYRKPGELVNPAPVETMNRGYENVRKIADMRGVRIVNVSRKSALEAFDRGTVEEALADLKVSEATL